MGTDNSSIKQLNQFDNIKSFIITSPQWIPMDGKKYTSHIDYLAKIVKHSPRENFDNPFVQYRVNSILNDLKNTIDKNYSSYTSFYLIEYTGSPQNIVSSMNFRLDEEHNAYLKSNKIFEVNSSAIAIEDIAL